MIKTAIEASAMLLKRSQESAQFVIENASDESFDEAIQQQAKRYFDAGIELMVVCHQAVKTRKPPALSAATQAVLCEVEREAPGPRTLQ